jgi:hypothetical protein
MRLIHGPIIREYVFKGARVYLGANMEGEFALTLWYFENIRRLPDVSEISFMCRIKDDQMPLSAALRAQALFVGMQNELADWANRQDASKTALALPQ